MSFKVDNWGAEIANAKSLLKGVNYYRYEIPSGDTITTPGYFPKDLGLKLGDRIWVIPTTKTDTDLLYTVSNISNYGVITVSLAAGQGDTLPAQTGNAGKFLTTDGTNASWAVATTTTVPSTMPELTVADWSSDTQTVNVTGVTADNVVFVSPAPASAADYAAAGIVCTAQSTNSLTFSCQTVPSNAITVNVVILG